MFDRCDNLHSIRSHHGAARHQAGASPESSGGAQEVESSDGIVLPGSFREDVKPPVLEVHRGSAYALPNPRFGEDILVIGLNERTSIGWLEEQLDDPTCRPDLFVSVNQKWSDGRTAYLTHALSERGVQCIQETTELSAQEISTAGISLRHLALAQLIAEQFNLSNGIQSTALDLDEGLLARYRGEMQSKLYTLFQQDNGTSQLCAFSNGFARRLEQLGYEQLRTEVAAQLNEGHGASVLLAVPEGEIGSINTTFAGGREAATDGIPALSFEPSYDRSADILFADVEFEERKAILEGRLSEGDTRALRALEQLFMTEEWYLKITNDSERRLALRLERARLNSRLGSDIMRFSFAPPE